MLLHIDVQQLMSQKETNLQKEIDRPDVNYKKRHQVSTQIFMALST